MVAGGQRMLDSADRSAVTLDPILKAPLVGVSGISH